jgi:hypothetical protein
MLHLLLVSHETVIQNNEDIKQLTTAHDITVFTSNVSFLGWSLPHKNLSWSSWEYSYGPWNHPCSDVKISVLFLLQEQTMIAAAAYLFVNGVAGCGSKVATLARYHPMELAAWSHISRGLTRVCWKPDHRATRLRESKSDGFDWLGTRSNHMWLEYLSSKRRILLSTWLDGSLLDQPFKKLPLTDSLSEKATTRRPSEEGHHNSAAISKASISSSWIIVCWPDPMAVSKKGLSICSLKMA